MTKQFDNLTADQIREEITQRLELLPQLVGWLYPSILADEIAQLREKYVELTGKYDHP